ncbi:serine hydrolase domain-containing protein [Acuticoccus mangrovi]|uniref:Beta-lactamase family protein n=1 Tax=Acuticoccus mangrovi TaxID=2796142 RepID=A0A934IQE5_9HYPH|nr:serine hydrolase domain-containing protein [Acuticoccus mangrovi]MBJ3776795.1 beta-lactamase family protein [Acuticoccus mangrovi]
MGSSDSQVVARLDAVFDGFVVDGNVVGASVAVSREGDKIYMRCDGFADRESGRRVTADSLYRLASLTKLVTSVTALSLWDEKRLDLAEPVRTYLPWFETRLADGTPADITLSELMSHSGGLTYGFLGAVDGPMVAAGVSDGLDDARLSLAENCRRIATVPLICAPGSAWNYSVSTDVLGAVIEAVTGEPLPQAVSARVTGPLGMVDTAFTAVDPARLTKAYAIRPDGVVPMSDPQELPSSTGGIVRYSPGRALDSQAFPSGGSGMVGSLDDYLALLEAIRTGGAPILSPEAVRLLVTDQVAGLDVPMAGAGWGFGHGVAVLRDPAAAGTARGEGAWRWAGVYGLSYWVDPASGTSAVSMTNTAGTGKPGHFHDSVTRAVHPDAA